MAPPGADTVVVRYGEMGTKSRRVRARMERRLADNLGTMLDDRDVAGRVDLLPTRPLIRTDEPDAAAAVATETFGVVSASPAVSAPPDRDSALDALTSVAREAYDGGTFAVSARRAGEHPFTSHDLEVEGGDAVRAAIPDRDPPVDLDDPDHTFSVEVREDEAFVFTEKRSGPGGFPLGTQAPVVALVSGGIDSPVAAYEVMRRGSPVVPVYVDLGDYGGPDHRSRAIETVRTLSRYVPGRDLPVHVVPGGDAVAALVEAMDRGRMLAYRRFMYRVAEHVADAEGAHGVVTGEAIGQKSSQTTRNLAVTSAATRLPVHRPLLSADKTEITERAREIGTFEDATIDAGCNRVAPDSPVIAGRLDDIRAREPDDLFERAERAAAAAERVTP